MNEPDRDANNRPKKRKRKKEQSESCAIHWNANFFAEPETK